MHSQIVLGLPLCIIRLCKACCTMALRRLRNMEIASIIIYHNDCSTRQTSHYDSGKFNTYKATNGTLGMHSHLQPYIIKTRYINHPIKKPRFVYFSNIQSRTLPFSIPVQQCFLPPNHNHLHCNSLIAYPPSPSPSPKKPPTTPSPKPIPQIRTLHPPSLMF